MGRIVEHSPYLSMLSYIWQEHCWIVAFSQCLVIKCRMTSFKIISVYIISDCCSSFLDIVVLCQICLFILEAAKPAFNHDIISPTAFVVHTLTNLVLFYKVNVLLTCELATLIRIKNLWFCHFKRLFKALITFLISSVSSTS